MACTDPPTVKTLQDRIKPDTLIKIGDTNKDPRFVVGYWSIRGLGAPLRMMLCAAGIPFWVALYDTKEEGETGWSKQSWIDDKDWSKKDENPFMNLPYLIDCKEQVFLCQTNAIKSYLGRELDMLGSSKIETAQCEELLCEIYDLRNIMVRFAYGTPENTPDNATSKCFKPAKSHLDKLEAYLSKKEKSSTTTPPGYLVGSKLSAPDFHLYEMLDQFELLAKFHDMKDYMFETNFPKLAEYKTAFEGHDANSFYLNSQMHKELPLNNVFACFGSSLDKHGKYTRGEARPYIQRGEVLLPIVNKKRTAEQISK